MNILSKLLLVKRLKNQFYNWDKEQLTRHQSGRITWMLAYVRKHSPYYRHLLQLHTADSLDNLPIINKAEMMQNFDSINTRGLHRDELLKFRSGMGEAKLGLYKGLFSVGVSSGTSGNRGLTVLSREEMEKYSCILWARSGIPDNLKKHRVLFLLRLNNPAFMEVHKFGIKIVYADYNHTIEELVKLINEHKLNILAGPPSLLSMLAQKSNTIDQNIDAIISYAEVLDDNIRQELEKCFSARVVQIYQSAEGFIGSTCRLGKLHLNEDLIKVDFEDMGDKIGNAKNVIITDLYRTTQPILRYSINDILEMSLAPCTCGSCFRVIDHIHGRADDIFHLMGDGGQIRYLFPDYVSRSIIAASDAVLEYQAIQQSMDLIEIRLILKEGSVRAEIEQAILGNLQYWAEKAGGKLGKVAFTEAIPERNPRSLKLIRVARNF